MSFPIFRVRLRCNSTRRRLSFLWLLTATLVLFVLLRPAYAQLVGEGKIFARITNTRPDGAPMQVRLHVTPNQEQPFTWDGRTVYVGREGESDKPLPETQWLAAGQTSPWIDLGKSMVLQPRAQANKDYLAPVLFGVMTAGNKDGLYLTAEIATGADKKLLRRIEVTKPEHKSAGEWEYPWRIGFGVWNHGPVLPTLGLLVPTRPEVTERIYTLEEALRVQLEFIASFPDYGRLPNQFIFTSRARPELLKALGYNGYPPTMAEGNLGDEIGIHLTMKPEEQDQRFRTYLKNRGFDPLELMADADREKAKTLLREEQWQFVHVLPALPDKPKQFYESAVFRYNLWYEELAAQRRKIEAANPGKKVLTGANFSPHMNVWPDVRQWVDPFRHNAMTMSWTEDWWWQLPETSPQGYGFLLSAFRLAHTYHGAPTQFYVMPFKGQSTANFRRMNALALAQGTKIFNHFVTGDQVLSTHDYIDYSRSPEMYRTIHEVIREIGAVEKRLYPAMPRKAQVAILLSRAGDTWDTEDLGGAGHLYDAQYNVNNEERKSLYLALRHAQIPVDVITDADIAEGKLAPYKVLYVVGSEMLAAAAEPLKAWVAAGGVLYATGGGGLLDEYHRPLNTLLPMYGITGQELVRKSRHIRPRSMLPTAEPLDTLTLQPIINNATSRPVPDLQNSVRQMPALWYRETLQPVTGAHAWGRYNDNSAGVVFNRFGKGRTMYVGILAGLAYVRPAQTSSSQILPTAFPEDVRNFITTPVRLAGVIPPVRASQPLVEAQLMEGHGGRRGTMEHSLVLINWSDQPVQDLVIQFPGLKNLKRVRSLRAAGPFKGELQAQQTGLLKVMREKGVPTIRLRLETTDYLLLD